jgi:hypothetical protein
VTSGRIVFRQEGGDIKSLFERAFNLLLLFSNEQRPLFLETLAALKTAKDAKIGRAVCKAVFPQNIDFLIEVSTSCDKKTEFSVSLVVDSKPLASGLPTSRLSYCERYIVVVVIPFLASLMLLRPKLSILLEFALQKK